MRDEDRYELFRCGGCEQHFGPIAAPDRATCLACGGPLAAAPVTPPLSLPGVPPVAWAAVALAVSLILAR